MKETGMIFTTESVRAILDGRKTMTRRVIKLRDGESYDRSTGCAYIPYKTSRVIKCPYGQVGDRLWVKETWTMLSDYEVVDTLEGGMAIGGDFPVYKAGGEKIPQSVKWTSPLFMPRWASRITLEITGVRVERLQEITREDCYKEGITNFREILPMIAPLHDPLNSFKSIWDSISAKRGYGWDTNCWVWVISFATGVRLK